MRSIVRNPNTRNIAKLACLFLAVALVDELVDSLKGASWPAIRSDLELSYLEVGVLLSAPHVFGCLVELFLGLLADHGYRLRAMLFGGSAFVTSLVVVALAADFPALLFGLLVFNPASGAFVSLSQASLMDLYPTRREQMMARWTLSGTIAHLLGPVAFVSLSGWRESFLLAAALALCSLAAMARLRANIPAGEFEVRPFDLGGAFSSVTTELRKPSVLEWLAALELADLMLDVLTGFLALYLVDELGMSPEAAALMIFVRAGAAVLGEALAVSVLERVDGLTYLAWSSALAGVSYILLLCSSSIWAIAVTLTLVTIGTSGWYSVLKANLYGALPNRSGAVMAISAVTGLVGGVVPLGLGWMAEALGIAAAMWVLVAGAISVFTVALSGKLKRFREMEVRCR